MARNKNSTALFDVIHAAKKPPKASPSASIPTPRWWGKDRKDVRTPQTSSPASTENVGRQQSWLSAAKKNTVAPPAPSAIQQSQQPAAVINEELQNQHDQSLPDPTVIPAEVENSAGPSDPIKPKARFIDRFVNRAVPPVSDAEVHSEENLREHSELPVDAAPSQSPASPAEASPSNWTDSEFVQLKPDAKREPAQEPAFRIDPLSKEFRFRLSYGGLSAVGFIFAMALAIAFIVGRHSGIETADADTATTAKPSGGAASQTAGLMAGVGPAKPVSPLTHPSNNNLAAQNVNPNVLKVGPGNPKPAVTPESFNTSLPTAPPLPISKTREIGMEYVIIQSYDSQELAQKACNFVNQNSDVQCTVVQGPSEWAFHDWYSVVGLRPFIKHDPALPDYERKVKAVGTRFTSKTLDQFGPQAYTWRADSDLSQQ